jgi:photosystem II stability/assembly factor-like uncharacterized protein
VTIPIALSALAAACAGDPSYVRVDTLPERFGPVVQSPSVPNLAFDEVPAALPQSEGASGFHMLTHTAAGYLAFGFDTDSGTAERSAVWRSDDLRRWERTGRSLGALSGRQEVRAVSGTGSDLVAVGGQRDELGTAESERAKAWFSEDGGTLWTPADLGGLELQHSALVAVVEVRDGPLAVGSMATPSGMSDAILLRTDDDGRSWVRDPLSHAEGISFVPVAAVADGGEVLVTGRRVNSADGSNVAMVWRSTDGGRTWYTEDLPEGTSSGPGVLEDGRAVVLGNAGAATMAWTSVDGGPWQPVHSDVFTHAEGETVRPTAITRHGQCLYAIGAAAVKGQASYEATNLAWRSCDGGATWVDLGYTVNAKDGLRENEGIASTPAGVVIIGWTFSETSQQPRLTRILTP